MNNSKGKGKHKGKVKRKKKTIHKHHNSSVHKTITRTQIPPPEFFDPTIPTARQYVQQISDYVDRLVALGSIVTRLYIFPWPNFVIAIYNKNRFQLIQHSWQNWRQGNPTPGPVGAVDLLHTDTALPLRIEAAAITEVAYKFNLMGPHLDYNIDALASASNARFEITRMDQENKCILLDFTRRDVEIRYDLYAYYVLCHAQPPGIVAQGNIVGISNGYDNPPGTPNPNPVGEIFGDNTPYGYNVGFDADYIVAYNTNYGAIGAARYMTGVAPNSVSAFNYSTESYPYGTIMYNGTNFVSDTVKNGNQAIVWGEIWTDLDNGYPIQYEKKVLWTSF